MLADPRNEYYFEYQETLETILRATGFDRREHSRHELELAEQCRHQPRSAGRASRPDLTQARCAANTQLLRQSYSERIRLYLPFMSQEDCRRAEWTLRNLTDVSETKT